MFIAVAAGQILISQIEISATSAFNMIVAIFAMALALVSLTRTEPPQLTAAAAFWLGSIAGPLLGTSFVIGFGIDGVPYLIATAALLLALFAAARSLISAPLARKSGEE
jgi:hypothetical protein